MYCFGRYLLSGCNAKNIFIVNSDKSTLRCIFVVICYNMLFK